MGAERLDSEDESIPSSCGHCQRSRLPGAAWYVCAHCRSVGYCCRAHQRLALIAHKAVCEPDLCKGSEEMNSKAVAQQAEQQSRAIIQSNAGDSTASCPRISCVDQTAGFHLIPPHSIVDTPSSMSGSATSFTSAVADVQRRILCYLVASPWSLRQCFGVNHVLQGCVDTYSNDVLRSPWWLLNAAQRALLALALAFCAGPSLLRAACACSTWRVAAKSRAAWRGARLNFGWGVDGEMRSLLHFMQRVAESHSLEIFPEERPSPPPIGQIRRPSSASAASSPKTPAARGMSLSEPSSPVGNADLLLDGLLRRSLSDSASHSSFSLTPQFFPPSGHERHTKSFPGRPSQLVLCRHVGLIGGETSNSEAMWLLQEDGQHRHGDVARRLMCRFLADNPMLVNGKNILEVDSVAGLVGIFACHKLAARAATLTTPGELGCRLLHLNGTRFATARGRFNERWSGSSRKKVEISGLWGPVPVYVYALQVSRAGADKLTKQWQWDSGTAMRSLQAQFIAPEFDVLIDAGLSSRWPSGSVATAEVRGLLEVAAWFLADGGLLIAIADHDQYALIVALLASASGWEHGLAIEEDCAMRDSVDSDGALMYVITMRRSQRSPTRAQTVC